jgi:putative colanic acid biosynthesis UDP-glucose lipid carrier transferase
MKGHFSGNALARLFIGVADFIIMNTILLICCQGWIVEAPPIFHFATKMVTLLANLSMLVSEYYFSTIVHWRRVKMTSVMRNTFMLTFLQTALMFFFIKLIDSQGGGVFYTMMFFFASEFILIFASRIIEYNLLRAMRRSGKNTRSVILVGNDDAMTKLYQDLIHDPSYGYRVKGYFADSKNEIMKPHPPYLGTLEELQHMERVALKSENDMNGDCSAKAESYQELLNVDEIYCCLPKEKSEMIADLMRYCDRNLIHYFQVLGQSSPFHLYSTSISVDGLYVFTNHCEPLEEPTNRFIKRAFDIVFSLIVCICLIPLIPIIGLIIKIQSPGPIFFSQERTGYNGKIFKCYKFRSMHVNKDADKVQATEHDVRKFAFGDFMRKCNIDELPQFYNVLIGNMSIVGPRPHMLYHTEYYSKLINEYMVRHLCKPGITGLAQVRGFRGETKELWQMKDRVRMDIWYIEHWSVMLDLAIIAKTFISIFKHDKNAY